MGQFIFQNLCCFLKHILSCLEKILATTTAVEIEDTRAVLKIDSSQVSAYSTAVSTSHCSFRVISLLYIPVHIDDMTRIATLACRVAC